MFVFNKETGWERREIEKEAERLGGEMRMVSLIGRFWSLDREENWDRIEKSYRWLVEGKGRAVPAVVQ